MIKNLLSKIVNFAVNILALLAIISFVVLSINKIFVIVTDETFIKIMSIIVNYAGLLSIILVAIKCALKLPFFLRIPYYILIIAMILLSFFQPFYDALIQTFLPTITG